MMIRSEKPVHWVGSAHRDLRGFPTEARRRAGHELHQLQRGLAPGDWKPMRAVGPGAGEIRISTERHGGRVEHRIFYVAKFEEAIWVLHAFQKTSRRTSRHQIEIGKERYAAMLRARERIRSSDGRKR